MIRSLLILIPLAVLFAGCGDKDAETAGAGTKEPEAHDDHAHAAKHDGDLLELGAHEGFLEVKMDHDAGTVTIWSYLGEEMKDTKLGDVPVLNFKAADKPMQLKGKLQSDGSWQFADASLKGEPEGARFRIVMAGKTYSPEWSHSHDHDGHDHDGESHGDEEHDGHDHDGEDHDDHDHDDHDHDGEDHDEHDDHDDHDHDKKPGDG